MKEQDLLDQQARKVATRNVGTFAWPTVLLGLCVFLGYLSLPVFLAAGLLGLPLLTLLAVLLTYAAYTVLHESVHGSICGAHSRFRWVNEMLGYASAFVLMIPLTAHRHEHLAHHRNTNNPEQDPDYVVSDMMASPWRAVGSAIQIVTGQYRYYLKDRWRKDPASRRVRFCLELAVAVGARLLFMAQGFWLEGAVLFVAGGAGGITLLMYLFAYKVHAPHTETGRYRDTSTFLFPGYLNGILTLLWGFQNYHSIHHLFPRVPFYRYPKVFNEIRHIMEEKDAPIHEWRGAGTAETGAETA